MSFSEQDNPKVVGDKMTADEARRYAGSSDQFQIKDSGKRQEFDSGMVRDTEDDKVDYSSLAFGPMLYRWAQHCTAGRLKYPDPSPGIPNWTLAKGMAEYLRFKASAFRHFMAWFWGIADEDHAAGVFFNINGAEYVKRNMESDATGMVPPGPPQSPRLPRDKPYLTPPNATADVEEDGRSPGERGWTMGPPGDEHGPG